MVEPPHTICFWESLPPRPQRLVLLTCARNIEVNKSVTKNNPFLVGYFAVHVFFFCNDLLGVTRGLWTKILS